MTTTSGAGAAARHYADFAANFTVAQLMVDATDLVAAPENLILPGPGVDAAPVPAATNYMVPTNCFPGWTHCQAVSVRQLPCNLNNTSDIANYGIFREGWNASALTPYLISPAGVGTLIGWQTDPGPAIAACNVYPKSSYKETILQVGINNGAQIIEVSLGEATLSTCQLDLSATLQEFPVADVCSYINGL
ncbi:MAG: hypothetical protein POG24_11785 [Acidocella sp.]|nr:hypothetical protein [Acidocella sp.]